MTNIPEHLEHIQDTSKPIDTHRNQLTSMDCQGLRVVPPHLTSPLEAAHERWGNTRIPSLPSGGLSAGGRTAGEEVHRLSENKENKAGKQDLEKKRSELLSKDLGTNTAADVIQAEVRVEPEVHMTEVLTASMVDMEYMMNRAEMHHPMHPKEGPEETLCPRTTETCTSRLPRVKPRSPRPNKKVQRLWKAAKATARRL